MDDDGGGIPEWVVTFGDMMSLLLTFFIMLVSMSDVKQERKFHAVVESMRRQFGHEKSMAFVIPGQSSQRNSRMNAVATMGRARKLDTKRGGDKTKAPSGDYSRVQAVRPADHSVIGGPVFFPEGSDQLEPDQEENLRFIASLIRGKTHKIEIRGHSSTLPIPPESSFSDPWQLALARCRTVMEDLIGQGISSQRMRISAAGDTEPLSISEDPLKRRRNARVEVLLLEETVEDFQGTPDEKRHRYQTDNLE